MGELGQLPKLDPRCVGAKRQFRYSQLPPGIEDYRRLVSPAMTVEQHRLITA